MSNEIYSQENILFVKTILFLKLSYGYIMFWESFVDPNVKVNSTKQCSKSLNNCLFISLNVERLKTVLPFMMSKDARNGTFKSTLCFQIWQETNTVYFCLLYNVSRKSCTTPSNEPLRNKNITLRSTSNKNTWYRMIWFYEDTKERNWFILNT